MEQDLVTSAIEAILFAAEKPVSIDRLQEVLAEQCPAEDELKTHLEAIKERCLKTTHGFELREAQGGFHFVTKASNAEYIRRFLQTRPFRLGRSAMEVLSIIAYRQPITRAEIDQVRGIDSSHLMRTLIERGLVKMTGKAEIPGRPVQYGTTPKFLEVVGLASLAELPPLSELEQIQGDVQDPAKVMEEGLNRFIDESATISTESSVNETDVALAEIDDMIQSAKQGSKEVHASPLHAEIAESNEVAVTAYQEFAKPLRKKKGSVTFEELTGSPPPPEVPVTPPTVVN